LSNYILRIDCPDEVGIVHRVTGVLYKHSLNIISNGEFVDPRQGRFFMRTEFAPAKGSGSATAGTSIDELLQELRSSVSAAANVELTQPRPKDIVVLATKESHCLGDLLLRNDNGELPARIQAVISNYDRLQPLVERFEIPYHHVPHADMERGAHERELLATIGRYQSDYLVLAKYMRILSSDFVASFSNRCINIHHSFLPAFAGARPYGQAFDRGVKIIGATAHFVNEDLDEGPIISQSVIPIDHTHSAADMAQAGRDVEKFVLAKALKLVLEDRVFVSGNRTVIFD
jgi:formyltetrahydrofolate deformylase